MAKTEGTLALDQQSPAHGDTITFTVDTNADYPHVLLKVYQGDTQVLAAQAPYFSEPGLQQFTLAAEGWEGGGHAVATLIDTNAQGQHPKQLDEIEFDIT